MKYQNFLFISLILFFVTISTSALAQTCPEGSQTVIDPNNHNIVCISTPVMEVSAEQGSSDPEPEFDSKASGAFLEIGVGYGMITAADFRAAVGFQVGLPSTNGLSFNILTDFNFRYPSPKSLDWSVIPMLKVHSDRFSVGFGFGLGIFHMISDDHDMHFLTDSSVIFTFFQMKPELRFDWFLTKNIYLGLVVDIALVIYKDEEIYYEPEFHSGEKKDVTYAFPWVSMTLNVGYKF